MPCSASSATTWIWSTRNEATMRPPAPTATFGDKTRLGSRIRRRARPDRVCCLLITAFSELADAPTLRSACCRLVTEPAGPAIRRATHVSILGSELTAGSLEDSQAWRAAARSFGSDGLDHAALAQSEPTCSRSDSRLPSCRAASRSIRTTPCRRQAIG